MPLASIETALEKIRAGEIVILVDDEDRENEGDLVIAAEKVTPESINFMAKHGRGLICLSLTEERLNHLDIPLMVNNNTAPLGTAFTVSIEAREGVSTGISAADRARTIQVAVDDASGPQDLTRPGHVFPLRSLRGGVLARTGQTEGSVDLCRLAGVKPAGVICEIMRDDGEMARMPDLEVFAEEHGLIIISVADLIRYRLQRESLLERVATAPLQCEHGQFEVIAYRSIADGSEHLAVVKGDPSSAKHPVLARVARHCCVSDVFGSQICGCGFHVRESLRRIEQEGCGVLVYIFNEQRSPSQNVLTHLLGHKQPAARSAEETNKPSVDLRILGTGAQILRDLGVTNMRLMTRYPKKIVGLGGYGLHIVEQFALEEKNPSPKVVPFQPQTKKKA